MKHSPRRKSESFGQTVMQSPLVFGALIALAAAAAAQSHPASAPQTKAPTPATATSAAKAPLLSPQASAEAIESCMLRTGALLDALDRADYTTAETDFDPTIRAALSPAQLQQAWESLPAQFGRPGSRGAPQNVLSGGYVVVTVPIAYEKADLAAQVACDAEGKIGGFHMYALPSAQPAPAASAPAPAANTAPSRATTNGH